MTESTRERFCVTHARLLEKLRVRAIRELPFLEGNFPTQEFAEALHRSVCHRFQGSESAASGVDSTGSPQVAEYLSALHVEDLALACACSAGHEAAWEHFIRTYRPQLHAGARAIVGHRAEGGDASARELADSLYAELFGLTEREGQRRSLFTYFHGRSKLSTWLRAILAQRYVDALRAGRREESLDAAQAESDEIPRQVHEPVAAAAEPDPDRARLLGLLQDAVSEAIAGLEARDRLRLAYYYAQGLTLAQIGRLLGEHEATVSRKLERTRRELRARVERSLLEDRRLSDAQVRFCYQYAQEEWPFDLTGALAGHVPDGSVGGDEERR